MDASGIGRRKFIGSAIVAGAAAPVAGCAEKAVKRIIPYVVPPEDVVPGEARFYRTVCRACPAGCGLSVRTREGRAVKVEGNPDHPVNRGAVCARGQGAIFDLYDVERLREPRAARGRASAEKLSWEAAERALVEGLKKALEGGKKVAIASRPEPGSLGSLFRSWLTALGQDASQLATLDPLADPWSTPALAAAFGAPDAPAYQLGAAKMILSVGADFLDGWGSPVEMPHGFSEMRQRTRAEDGRFVYLGPRLSATASAADQWLAPAPGSELDVVLCLARAALAAGPKAELAPAAADGLRSALEPYTAESVERRSGISAGEIQKLAESFLGASPSLCLGPGPAVATRNGVALATAVHLLNYLSGNVGQTVLFHEREAAPAAWTLEELARAVEAGEVGALIVHHADLLGMGPLAARLRAAWAKVPFVAAFANRLDETARAADLVLADHHFLEAWGDLPVRPGVLGLQQPAMVPLHPTRPAADVLLAAARKLEKGAGLPEGDFASFIRGKATPSELEKGGRFSAEPLRTVALPERVQEALAAKPTPTPDGGMLSLVLFPTLRYQLGPGGANALLEEIPDPVSTICWSGWVELHPETAEQLSLATGDRATVKWEGGTIELPAWVYPGVRRGMAALPAGIVAGLPAAGTLVQLAKAGPGKQLARTEGSPRQLDRMLAREVPTVRSEVPKPHVPKRSMYPEHAHKRRWAMAVDLDRCTGCSACMAACYVENNTPVVGPTDVAHGREMSWIRMDRFIDGPDERPRLSFLPVMCQQCCNAPCEGVCPVYVTYHHHEGLNAQIYNRCVGTRYCENNCPYHARRFNWWNYPHPEPSHLALNPDVTVRERGITEKCSFCIQRIRSAEEHAKLEGRPVRDGEVVPACAQTCPTQAIVFGDIRDGASGVAKVAADPRAYRMMEQLNAEPGVYYLARVRPEDKA
ncbi:MAG: 4Fe-4S dicluster domain-containing protein [Myxococcales bacterium]|nr:4Fe-4S dicluster domain-containing protein [Myxococcales bacterium]